MGKKKNRKITDGPDSHSSSSSSSGHFNQGKGKNWWQRSKIWNVVIAAVAMLLGGGFAIAFPEYLLHKENTGYTKEQTEYSKGNLEINEDVKNHRIKSDDKNTDINERRLEVQRDTLHRGVIIEKQQLIDSAHKAATEKLGTSLSCPSNSFERSSLQQANETVQNYIDSFNPEEKSSRRFLLSVGVKAAGKTTLLEQILCEKKCIIHIDETLTEDTDLNNEWLMTRIRDRLDVEDYPSHTKEDFLKSLSTWCTRTHGSQLTIYADLGINSKSNFTWSVVEHFGQAIGTFGRKYTYDTPLCPIIIETSISQISDAITQKHGNICEKVHVPRLNLEEFAISYALMYDDLFDSIIGSPKGTISVPSLAENVPNYTAALEDWYYRLGSNMRDLGDVLNVLNKSGGGREMFMGNIIERHIGEIKPLVKLEDTYIKYLRRVAESGPSGYLHLNSSDVTTLVAERTTKDTLLERGPKDTIIYLRGDEVSMWRMSHVYYLLSQCDAKGDPAKSHEETDTTTEKKDDKENPTDKHGEIVKKMKEYGWV